VSTPATTNPPYVPIRHGGWPVRRTPLWLLAVVVAEGSTIYSIRRSAERAVADHAAPPKLPG
jgi:hypothetical protein